MLGQRNCARRRAPSAPRRKSAALPLRRALAVAAIGAAVGGADQNVARALVIQGAGPGAQLVQTKYGRDQELKPTSR